MSTRNLKTFSLVLVWVLSLIVPQRTAASNDGSKTLSPYFAVENGDPEVDGLPLKKTKIDVDISAVIANVKVTQIYVNKGTRPINATYVFPASTRAAVHGMTMRVGEQIVKAKIKKRSVAKQEFENAIDRKSATR